MVCRRQRKGSWISVLYTLFQRTFRGLWTGNCLLEKYYIRLPRIFAKFWVNLGCACVCFDLIKSFIFWIFILSPVYTCKYNSRVSIHQPLVSYPFGSSNIASNIKEKNKTKNRLGLLEKLSNSFGKCQEVEV